MAPFFYCDYPAGSSLVGTRFKVSMDDLEQDIAGSQNPLLHVLSSPSFRRDAESIAHLDEALVTQVGESLGAINDFISPNIVGKIAKDHIKDEKAQGAIVRYVWNLQAYFQTSEREIGSFLQICVDALERAYGNDPQFPLDALIIRTKLLVAEFPGITKYFKAAKVATRTGWQAQQAAIVCDIRPVFDKQRTSVDGAVLLSTLRIDYQSNEGDEVLELRVSKTFLLQAQEEIARALMKLDALNSLCDKASLKIVDLEEVYRS